jgi:hypothetical protein
MVTGQQQTVSQKILQCFLLHTRSKEKVVNFILQQKNFKGGSKIIFPTPQTTTTPVENYFIMSNLSTWSPVLKGHLFLV